MQIQTVPPILISQPDYERLSALVGSAQTSAAWPDLVEELGRAEIVAPRELPPGVVTMGAQVDYVDGSGRPARRVTLVYPGSEDIAAGRISVLTPIGTALIGLSVGQTMAWVTRGGERKYLTVTAVARPEPGAAAGQASAG